MSDNHHLLSELLAAQQAGKPVVLATVIKAHGSVPRRSGSKMLVFADGRISGSIGGGEMESRVVDEALLALQDGRSRLLPYTLVEPSKGDPGVCGGEVEIYIEPYPPPATLLIIGCGHVGRAVAQLGKAVGYRIVVNDDRQALATAENMPDADLHLPGSIKEVLTQSPITSNTYIIMVTRNVTVDREIIPHIIHSPARYIGVMGSRRRWTETQKLLIADGLKAEDLARIHAPIGLEIEAETPEEIAVSILAQIIQIRRH
ncbi:Xanthine and CO dehydrogenases maturation factor, XdhC/CoxF family [hydrothermal vent metagenome]|uniref:Xanthine and CO dehydrogenases maturation factor, XdhC/CoxF family n=1 Tax=hydrothermal vent metagenome TaxID=652676 RepID=A0A3B0V6U8_9ZZZZ